MRVSRIAALAIVAFAGGLILARALLPGHEPPPATERATVFSPPRELPAFALTDQDGRRFGPEALRGHWTLVFFGFTQCPDVCPTTLATLVQVTRQLGDLPAEARPRVLLVSVDPERDTPERLAAYVRFFDPTFLGVTGDAAAIAEFARAFGVPFAKDPVPGGYTMDHGSGLFVVGPDGSTVAYSSAPHDATVIARDYRKVVAHTARQG